MLKDFEWLFKVKITGFNKENKSWIITIQWISTNWPSNNTIFQVSQD